MKTAKIISFVVIVGLAFSMLFSSCESNPDVTPQEDILPSKFSVDIPSSISNKELAKGGRIGGRVKDDSLHGNDIYKNLGTFIAVGEEASKLVEAFIEGIRKYKIDRVLSLTYVGEDDNRTKNLVVLSNSTFEGKTWDYQLTITDADSENQADGGKALQIFWNKSNTIEGIAIIKPYNCDRLKDGDAKDAVFRIDYSEVSDLGYDAQMEVLISGLPLANPLSDPFSINTLRMFVGKKGDVVNVLLLQRWGTEPITGGFQKLTITDVVANGDITVTVHAGTRYYNADGVYVETSTEQTEVVFNPIDGRKKK